MNRTDYKIIKFEFLPSQRYWVLMGRLLEMRLNGKGFVSSIIRGGIEYHIIETTLLFELEMSSLIDIDYEELDFENFVNDISASTTTTIQEAIDGYENTIRNRSCVE